MRNKPKFAARVGAAMLVISIGVLGLFGGSALAAEDSGPRKHAEGRYDASTGTYTVAAGDDLSEIAERFDTTVGELEELNKLTSDEIDAGQKLVVAGGLEGTVTVGGQPVGGATVTLWRTAGKDAPKSLAETTTDASGGFALRNAPTKADGNVFYLTTRGGAGDARAAVSTERSW